jgi:large subunit ribosomal protein L9
MKVILLQDVKDLGKKGTLCEVSDGYGRNFLLPRKLALLATEGNKQDLAHKQKREENRKQREEDEAQQLSQVVEATTLNLVVKTGERGRLFGSVTNKEIAETLAEKHGIKVDRRKIELSESIKTVGEYEAVIKLHPNVSAKLKILVTSSTADIQDGRDRS